MDWRVVRESPRTALRPLHAALRAKGRGRADLPSSHEKGRGCGGWAKHAAVWPHNAPHAPGPAPKRVRTARSPHLQRRLKRPGRPRDCERCCVSAALCDATASDVGTQVISIPWPEAKTDSDNTTWRARMARQERSGGVEHGGPALQLERPTPSQATLAALREPACRYRKTSVSAETSVTRAFPPCHPNG